MSADTSVAYRCPSCSAPGKPDESQCQACGHRIEDQTWVVDSDPGLSRSGGNRPGRFDGRYELLEELGRGGMGIVYRAFDRELDEVIALKVLAPAAGAHPDLVTRFKHEVKVARRLTHPNIARLHDLIEVRGQLCLSMEFLEGKSLKDVIAVPGRFEPDRVIRYLKALVPAIDLAHAMGIVHRDLKPQNVLVDSRDEPRILDFGIAKSEWLKEQNDGSPIGTPAYMAPEQSTEGADVDGRADIYSLGIMTYEMCTGRRPFEHRNRLILIEMHRTHAPKPPRAFAPNLPPAIEAVILKCLEKDPARRFAHAREILDALEPKKAPAPAPAVAAPLAAATPPVAARPPIAPRPKNRKVLVADDDDGVRDLLARLLRARGLTVILAADGAQAVEAAFKEIPALVFLDIRMPILDGLEALRLIKNDPRTRSAEIVVMSARREEDSIAFCKEYGAVSFLDKPIPTDVVDLVVERYMPAERAS